jgi:hypothetical protein
MLKKVKNEREEKAEQRRKTTMRKNKKGMKEKSAITNPLNKIKKEPPRKEEIHIIQKETENGHPSQRKTPPKEKKPNRKEAVTKSRNYT